MFTKSEIKSRKFSHKVKNKRKKDEKWKAGEKDKKNILMVEFLKRDNGGKCGNY